MTVSHQVSLPYISILCGFWRSRLPWIIPWIPNVIRFFLACRSHVGVEYQNLAGCCAITSQKTWISAKYLHCSAWGFGKYSNRLQFYGLPCFALDSETMDLKHLAAFLGRGGTGPYLRLLPAQHNTGKNVDIRTHIASRYGLDGLGIESQWRTRFSAAVQTGPWAHPASYTMGTGSLSRG